MPTSLRSPYSDVTLHSDLDHARDRRGPTTHGYPLLRLDFAPDTGHTLRARDGSEYVISNPHTRDSFPAFTLPVIDQLGFEGFSTVAPMEAWQAGRARVTVYEDGCVHVCPVEAWA